MSEKSANNFLIKIDKIRKRSYADSLFLKSTDVIVALNNQFYIYGEKRFVEELKDLKKNNEKAILTILRNDTYFDIIIDNSLGCTFITTDSQETERIKVEFSKKEIFDLDQLKEYIAMRDVYRRYDIYENSNSLIAGLFPPLWLSYSRKWWVLLALAGLMMMLFTINIFMALLGWIMTSVYCYKAQLNLLFSFSMLEGKAFSAKIAARSIDDAQQIIRNLDPKSRFLHSKLEDPKVEEESNDKESDKQEIDKNSNIVDEKKEALV